MCSYYLIYIQNTIGEKYKISFIKDKIMYTILPSQSSQQGLKFTFVFFCLGYGCVGSLRILYYLIMSALQNKRRTDFL